MGVPAPDRARSWMLAIGCPSVGVASGCGDEGASVRDSGLNGGASSTRCEIVVPVLGSTGEVRAVLEEARLETLLDTLHYNLGIECLADLRFLEESLLADLHLPPVHTRKLLQLAEGQRAAAARELYGCGLPSPSITSHITCTSSPTHIRSG